MNMVIAGIGGVGGYFGGLLARHYAGTSTHVDFIARGEHLAAIAGNGLLIESVNGTFTAHPHLATASAEAAGHAGLLICCTKGYDLEEMMRLCAPCITPETVILPLLNGVDAGERIRAIYPANEVWDGCVYLVARREAPGVIRESGNVRRMFFGAVNGSPQRLAEAEKIFQDAGIDAKWSKTITDTVWEKFLFISPFATLTSFLDKTISEVFADKANEALLWQLADEVQSVAERKGITIPAGVTRKNLERMRSLPAGSTTSMHSDFRKGGKTELESLTGYVIRYAAAFGIDVPLFRRMYDGLKGR